MKNFLIVLILCLSSFIVSKDKKSYLCRKDSAIDKDQKDLTISDCKDKVDGDKCCLVKIDQKDIEGEHRFCAIVEGDVNSKTIDKIKEDIGKNSDISIDCSCGFLKIAFASLIIIGIII